MHGTVTWGLFSPMISSLLNSLHSSIYPPEMEIYTSSEDGMWLPMRRVIKNGHTRNALTQWNASVSVQQHTIIPNDHRTVSWRTLQRTFCGLKFIPRVPTTTQDLPAPTNRLCTTTSSLYNLHYFDWTVHSSGAV